MATLVATVPTACGIETYETTMQSRIIFSLQQCLPLAVLKQEAFVLGIVLFFLLQQCLPLALLKQLDIGFTKLEPLRCNSAYRLRY